MDISKVSCFRCGLCCSSKMRLSLSELEYDFLEDFVKQNSDKPHIDEFNAFIKDKATLYCPYYDKERGCSVYIARPMCCRLFGNFHFIGYHSPRDSCAYKGMGIKVPLEMDYDDIKGNLKFKELRSKYECYKSVNDKEKLEALISLGQVYMRQEKWDDALRVFGEGEKISPSDSRIYYEMGCIYKWVGKLDMAREKLEKSLDLGAEKYFPCVYQSLGYVYSALGLQEKALSMFSTAFEKEPDSVLACLDMAFIKSSMGNKEEAIAYCNKALGMDGQNNMALKMKEFIENSG